MQHQIPVLDLDRFGPDREALVSEAGEAYRKFGFCGFRNHGIPVSVIEGAYDVFRQFFALSLGMDLLWFDEAVRLGNSVLRAIHYPHPILANDFLEERLREIKLL